jgi:predicted phage terminase large subunit-like protein
VIDDPVSGWEQAQSMTQLQKIHDWYKSDLKSRMKPRAKQVLVCQRLSANDLAGFMIAAHAENPTRRLRVINLPMVADSPDDPLGRQIGEILWPEWFTPEMVKDLQKDEFIWRTMYQQKPPAESGAWVSSEDIQFRSTPTITPETITYGCSDLALSVNSGDYTVHFIVAVDSRGDWDIIDASRERVDPDTSATRLVTFCQTYAPVEWLIDDDNASKVFMQLVATRARETGTLVPWKPMPMRGQDKETRAAALRGQYKRRRIFMPSDAPWARWLTTELLGFPNLIGQGVDDGVDALSCLGRRLFSLGKTASTEQPPKPPPKTWQDITLNEMWDDHEMKRSTRRRL